MNPRYNPLFAVVLLGLAMLSTPAPSAAQAPYDTPSLSAVDLGLFRIRLEVRAGASGAPEGFEVQWMKKADYDRLGGWPAAYDPLAADCDFTGVPTLNPDPRSSSFKLASDGDMNVEIGDLFDETGVYATYADGLQPGTAYVFRAYAKGAPGQESAPSANVVASTTGSAECTQGFWKTHPESWPPSCTPMLLGTVLYTQAQLLDIYNTPAQGNGLIFLAHQLITAKLNICNGSDPTPIFPTILAADALIDGLVVPPVGSGFLDPADASGLTETLDDYNNGKLGGVLECPTPVRHATWGSVKAMYR